MGQFDKSLRRLICLPIKLYQYILSPILPNSCRFHPSCSTYAIDAILLHGLGKGSLMACMRLCRCHPASLGGYDPIPEKREK
jgi:uncharacterized protein